MVTDDDARTTGGRDAVADVLGRPLRDLRISVTDRCNFRCTYCMPREVYGAAFRFLPHDQLLTFEEVTRVARAAAAVGVTKIRLTGGEPLLRREVEDLVSMLASVDGITDLTLTTNGSLLAAKAAALAEAGLQRVTVSLDSLDDATFARLNDVDFPVARVLEGIEAAARAGLAPIKLNMVVRRGLNDHDIVPMADYAREHGYTLRFIEYMDVGHTNGWELTEVVPSEEIVATIDAQRSLAPVPPRYAGEVASRWRYLDGSGEIGVISSVTQPFCGSCTRARLTAEGELYTCLFGVTGTDVRALLRGGGGDDQLVALLSSVWDIRADRYSEIRSSSTTALPKVEMSRIGG